MSRLRLLAAEAEYQKMTKNVSGQVSLFIYTCHYSLCTCVTTACVFKCSITLSSLL